jgi:hypothetical protein
MFLGAGMAGAGQTPPAPQTVEVPGPVKEVVKEVKVEKTPQSCLAALDLADQGFKYSSEAMRAAADGFHAAARFDVSGIEAANADLTAVNEKMSAMAPDLQTQKAECRAAK